MKVAAHKWSETAPRETRMLRMNLFEYPTERQRKTADERMRDTCDSEPVLLENP